jgi:hypothetical protein
VIDDLPHRDALGLGPEIDEDTVSQHGMGQGPDIVLSDMGSTVQQGSRFGAENEILRSPGPRTPFHPFVNELRGTFPMRPGSRHQSDRKPGDVF